MRRTRQTGQSGQAAGSTEQSGPTGRTRLGALLAVVGMVAAAVVAAPGTSAADETDRAALGPGADEPAPYRLVWDDFSNGFLTEGPDARWFFLTQGGYVADDGRATTSSKGLKVVASGTNPRTGEPAFVNTLGQEQDATSVPGTLDHVKWLALANHFSSAGFPGFDAVPGQELSCETWLSGRTYGTGGHPFGAAVTDPSTDARLAFTAMVAADFETASIFDFVVTNRRIYALYERLPDARAALGNYAAFTHLVPVGSRSPGDRHHLRIAYDRAAGVVRWLVDEREVFRVDRIGHRLDRKYLTIDHGGVETAVSPRQLECGMGMFTLLDGSLPTHQGLVRLSTAPDRPYFRPETGEPDPQAFLDERSLPSNRLFGQGAGLSLPRYVVSSVATDR